jgi:hypothetical protein
MKVFILAAIIAISPTLSNAADMPRHFQHSKKMTPRESPKPLCTANKGACTKNADCCELFCNQNICE